MCDSSSLRELFLQERKANESSFNNSLWIQAPNPTPAAERLRAPQLVGLGAPSVANPAAVSPGGSHRAAEVSWAVSCGVGGSVPPHQPSGTDPGLTSTSSHRGAPGLVSFVWLGKVCISSTHPSMYLYGPHLHHVQISRATRTLFAFFFFFSSAILLEFINRKAVCETHALLPQPQLEPCAQVWALLVKRVRPQLARAQRAAKGVTRDVENSP